MTNTISVVTQLDHALPTNESPSILGRLFADDTAQDILEYALLGALIGIAAIAAWEELAITVGEVYAEAVGPTGQVQSLSSCMPGPDGTGC